MKIIVVLASRSFIYYVINAYVPRVRANAYQALTTPPRVFRYPKMRLHNIWTAPYVSWVSGQWRMSTIGRNNTDPESIKRDTTNTHWPLDITIIHSLAILRQIG